LSTIAASLFYTSLASERNMYRPELRETERAEEKEKQETGNNEEDGNTARFFLAQNSRI
jgi:hypothetical protein